jgi:hypothetical protein
MSGRRSWLGPGLAVPVLLLALVAAPPAQGASVINTTVHVPASVATNPCAAGDLVNLNGDIHIVITTTENRAGGFQVSNHINSQLTGSSIMTGTQYVNSDDQEDSWFAGAPFPAVHTHTYGFVLLSKSSTDNYLLRMTMHETVNAMGVPTATVDKFSMDCQG